MSLHAPSKNILVLAKYGTLAASVRQRFLLYSPFLAKQNIELTVSPLFDNDYLSRRFATGRATIASVVRSYMRRVKALLAAHRYDLVMIHYDALPYFPAAFERLLMRTKIKYIYDYDDASFHQYDLSSNPIVRFFLGTKIASVVKAASLVFAGSPYLIDYAKNKNTNLVYVPTVVDTELYLLKKHTNSNERLVIGWIGSPSTTKYLQALISTIADSSGGKKIKLIAIGATPFPIDDVRCEVEFRKWSEETEVSDMLECDIGIMPLTDTPWSRGKCAFKLIQYMACGLPVVASPVGANVKVVTEDVGILASTPQQWREAFETLAASPDLRARMGIAGRMLVEEQYSLKSTAPIFHQSIVEMLQRGGEGE